MSKLEFSGLHGFVQEVPLEAYERITASYVEKVSSVEGVHGVVKIGSVSCPGLSDIDIVVVIDEDVPAPAWDDISIKAVADSDPHGSVVAHDVLVVPKKIADNVGAFFYIDNQKVLLGKGLSSTPSSAISPYLADFITFEYACHRLESLFKVLASPSVDLRTALLLVSTLRHTADLAAKLGVVAPSDALRLKESIEELRQGCVGVEDCSRQLEGWPERCLTLLWSVVVDLGGRFLGADDCELKRLWAAGDKQSVLDVYSQEAPLELWDTLIRRQKGSPVARRVKTLPMPSQYHRHIARYLGEDSASARSFRATFPGVGALGGQASEESSARKMRMGLVHDHWEFVDRHGYGMCSGKGYFGLNKQGTDRVKAGLYTVLNLANSHLATRKLARSIPSGKQ